HHHRGEQEQAGSEPLLPDQLDRADDRHHQQPRPRPPRRQDVTGAVPAAVPALPAPARRVPAAHPPTTCNHPARATSETSSTGAVSTTPVRTYRPQPMRMPLRSSTSSHSSVASDPIGVIFGPRSEPITVA